MAGERELVCPKCGSDELATSERLMGSAIGNALIDDAGKRSFAHEGYTEVHWDTSETVGVECRSCFWSSTAEDRLAEKYLDKLVERSGQEG